MNMIMIAIYAVFIFHFLLLAVAYKSFKKGAAAGVIMCVLSLLIPAVTAHTILYFFARYNHGYAFVFHW